MAKDTATAVGYRGRSSCHRVIVSSCHREEEFESSGVRELS